MKKIHFYYPYKRLPFRRISHIKAWVEYIFNEEKVIITRLDYIFCSDDYLLDINRNFLRHDYFTDIVTFDLSTNPKQRIGELYISLDRVKDNSKEFRVPYSIELLRVIFHGALHLCGYKDKTKREISLIREREDHYLRHFAVK